MQLAANGLLVLYVGRRGLGWRIGENWYRLRPSWLCLTYSERYGKAVIWRGFGWRITKRQTGRPWH